MTGEAEFFLSSLMSIRTDSYRRRNLNLLTLCLWLTGGDRRGGVFSACQNVNKNWLLQAEKHHTNQGTPRLLVSVSSRWSLVLLGVRDQVSVPVSLTLKKRDRTRYRYRSLKKIETGLGLGIINFKKTRPDSVSVSFTQKKWDRTRSRYRSL